MTAQATQSNSALGRRSLPSAFLAPSQALGRFMDRQGGEEPSADSSYQPDQPEKPDQSSPSSRRSSAAQTGTAAQIRPSPEDRLNGTRKAPSVEEYPQSTARRTLDDARPAAFAKVALRVWSEPGASLPASGRAASQLFESEFVKPGFVKSEFVKPEFVKPEFVERERERAAIILAEALPVSVPAHETQRKTAPQRDASMRLNEAQALAHDANNLLSALRLYGELLCFSGVLHERHRHYAEDLKLLSSRSERIIDRLFTLTEQDTAEAGLVAETSPAAYPFLPPRLYQVRPGDGDEAGESSDLASVLRRLKGLLGTIAQGALEVDLGGDKATDGEARIAVPAETLERIMVNLISNAAAAIRSDGAIRIRAAVLHDVIDDGRESDSLNESRLVGSRVIDGRQNVTFQAPPKASRVAVLTVDDSGCGMSETQVRAALGENAAGLAGPASLRWQEPVATGASSFGDSSSGPARRRRGLGLAIVRELVAATGGRLAVHSRQGIGTRIEIRWTAAESGSVLDGGRLAGALAAPRQTTQHGVPPAAGPGNGFAARADRAASGTGVRSTRDTGREAGYAAAAEGAVA